MGYATMDSHIKLASHLCVSLKACPGWLSSRMPRAAQHLRPLNILLRGIASIGLHRRPRLQSTVAAPQSGAVQGGWSFLVDGLRGTRPKRDHPHGMLISSEILLV